MIDIDHASHMLLTNLFVSRRKYDSLIYLLLCWIASSGKKHTFSIESPAVGIFVFTVVGGSYILSTESPAETITLSSTHPPDPSVVFSRFRARKKYRNKEAQPGEKTTTANTAFEPSFGFLLAGESSIMHNIFLWCRCQLNRCSKMWFIFVKMKRICVKKNVMIFFFTKFYECKKFYIRILIILS